MPAILPLGVQPVATQDLLRIVRYDEQDQLVVLSDLEKPSEIYKQRNTFRVVEATRESAMAMAAENRRGGGQQVAERRGLGAVGATWSVKGTTADEALARMGRVLADADSAAPGRYVLWRPTGATRVSLYRIVGTATTVALDYDAVRFAAINLLGVEVSWPVAPLVEEPRMDFADDFRARDLDFTAADQFDADYMIDSTVGVVSVTKGALETNTPGSSKTPVYRRDRRPWQDGWVTVKGKAKAGSSSSAHAVTPGLRYREADGAFFYATVASNTVSIRDFDGATSTTRASAAITMPTVGVDFWVRIRAEGQVVTAEYWTSQPTPYGAPTATATYSNAATVREGYPMLMSWSPGGSVVLAEWQVRPFSWRLVNTPAAITVPAVPGTAPALTDVEITTGTGDADYPRHLLVAWRRALSGTDASGLANVHKSMLIPGESYAAVGGAGSPAVVSNAALFRGGQAVRFTVTDADASGYADYRIDPTIFEADDFADDVTVAIFARFRRTNNIVAPRIRAELLNALGSVFAGAYTAEHGSVGRYLPSATATHTRAASLGTLRLPLRNPEPVVLRVTALWSAGTTAGGTFDIDEVYVVPVEAAAMSPTNKARDDGTYPALLLANGYTRRIKATLASELASWVSGGTGTRWPHPAGVSGAWLELPAGAPGAEVLVRPSATVPDDPTVGAATDVLAHNATIHLAVTPRHHLVVA